MTKKTRDLLLLVLKAAQNVRPAHITKAEAQQLKLNAQAAQAELEKELPVEEELAPAEEESAPAPELQD